MVRGLDLFKKRFAPFSASYVLIGGTACTLAMEERGFDFRATKDLDIVLCMEALENKFIETFWRFVKEGAYQYQQQSTGKKLFYRFYNPKDPTYPRMLELFSRKPNAITLRKGVHLTPIPISEEISSLSAILLNDDYYRFIHEGKQEVEGLPTLAYTHLIPLKARAWLDLSAQRDSGVHIDESDIRKHRNDVIRLSRLLLPNARISLPSFIRLDMQSFLEKIKQTSVDIKPFGVLNTDFNGVIAVLSQVYNSSEKDK